MGLSLQYLQFVKQLENNPELVKSEYQQGIQFVIDKYGISRSTVIKYLGPQNKYKTVNFDVDMAKQMRLDGITDREIAKKLGTYTTTLWRKLGKRSLSRSQEALEKIQGKSYSKLFTNERKLETRSWSEVYPEKKQKKWEGEIVEFGMRPVPFLKNYIRYYETKHSS